MRLSSAYITLALAFPSVLGGCVSPLDAQQLYHTAKLQCIDRAGDKLSSMEINSSKRKAFDDEIDRCMSAYTASHPDIAGEALRLEAKYPGLPLPDETITVFRNGHAVGGADVYVPGNGSVIVDDY